MQTTFLTIQELAARIHYKPSYIRSSMLGNELIEGKHFVRPFGRRKLLFIWEQIQKDMFMSFDDDFSIPMANGGVCHG